jgi:hypothetical protein
MIPIPSRQNIITIKKIEIKKPLEIVNKYSSLDTNLFLLPEISDYRCIICENIPSPENAYDAICCPIIFCKECLLKWIMQNQKCPICKKTLKNDSGYIRSIKESNKIFYKTMKKFIIKCPYECQWNGAWEDLENHIKECEKGLKECKYKYIGCEFIGDKEKLKNHEENDDKLHLEMAMKFIKDNQEIAPDINIDNNLKK